MTNLLPNYRAANIAQYLIAIAILFTFGLNFYVPMDILWKKIQHKISKERHNTMQIVVRCGIIMIQASVAIAVPDLEPFISLVGAVFFSSLGLMAPAIIEGVFLWPETGRFHWIMIKNVFLMIFATVALLAGSAVSIYHIIQLYTGDDDEIDTFLLTTNSTNLI